jgi:hypothetical protein
MKTIQFFYTKNRVACQGWFIRNDVKLLFWETTNSMPRTSVFTANGNVLNQWVGVPPRSHIKERFPAWSSHLYCFIIEYDNNNEDDTETTKAEMTETQTSATATSSTTGSNNNKIQNMNCRIMVQNQGGFQNDLSYLHNG